MKKLFLLISVLLCVICTSDASAQQDLKIISPNGDEKLIVGTDVDIRWQGVPPQKFVILDYSIDNGQSWKRITDKATGLKHTWKVPNDASKQCLLRANLVSGITPAEWARQTYGNGIANSVAFDSLGNIYVCGIFRSATVNFGKGIVINEIAGNGTLSPANDCLIAKYDYNGNILWAKSFGSRNMDNALSICADKQGNIYVSGFFGKTEVDFGNGVILTELENHHFFVAKFDTDGICQWARNVKKADFTETNIDISVTLDSKNNVIISGHTGREGLDFGKGVVLNPALIDSYDNVPFLAKYNSNGDILWAKKPIGYARISSVTTDTTGNIYTCGVARGRIDFGNGWIIDLPAGEIVFFISKYQSDGSVLWIKQIKGAGGNSNFPASLTVDRFGNVYVASSFQMAIADFGDGVTLSKTNNQFTPFLARYTQDGNIVWAQKVTGDQFGNNYVASVRTDYVGNIVLAGWFYSRTIDFGNSITLINTTQGTIENDDFFLVKYNPDGKALWAKKATGDDADYILSMAIDPYGSITVAGGFASSDLDFGNGITLINAGMILAKYDNEIPVGTQDFSDGTWSIIKPLVTSLNIDMGKVLISDSKDSVIQGFIRNVGVLPVDVRDIQITGANASEFTVITGKAPFIIGIGEQRTVEFRFTPSAPGIRSATISIVTPLENFNQTIVGEGIQPLISIISISVPFIDMGVVEIGNQKDSVVSAVVKNIGSAPLTITNTSLIGSQSGQFQVLSSSGSFVLQAGAEQTLQIRYSPQTIGRSRARLQFEYDGMTSGPAIAEITGFGVGGSIYIDNDSAYAGENRQLKLTMDKLNGHTLAAQEPVGFTAIVTYSNSILYTDKVIPGVTITKGIDSDTISITSQWNGEEFQIGNIPVTATLGDKTQTNLELLSYYWLDDSGKSIDYKSETRNGKFTMLGICRDGGERLFDINGHAQMIMIAPHPATGVVTLTFETVERGITKITLTNVLGQQILLKDGTFAKGYHTFEVDTHNLSSGMYILTMQTPTQIFTQQVIIGK